VLAPDKHRLACVLPEPRCLGVEKILCVMALAGGNTSLEQARIRLLNSAVCFSL
jgi:hypothetical protein